MIVRGLGSILSLILDLEEACLCSKKKEEGGKKDKNKPLEDHIKFTNICSSLYNTTKKLLSKEYFPG